MKKSLTTILLLATAPAFAHTNIAPHAHSGEHTFWIPTISIVATIAVAAYFFSRRNKFLKERKLKVSPKD